MVSTPNITKKRQTSVMKPKPFAFFRLVNDAFRTSVLTIDAGAKNNAIEFQEDSFLELEKELQELLECVEIVTGMETISLLPLITDQIEPENLDKLSALEIEVATKQDTLLKTVAEVKEGKNGFDEMVSFLDIAKAWISSFREHLKLKDDVFTPCYTQVYKEFSERATAVNSIIRSEDSVDNVLNKVLPFVLTRFINVKRSYGHTRMFCTILQYVSTPAQWKIVKEAIQSCMDDVTWAKLQKDGLKKGGKLPAPKDTTKETSLDNAKQRMSKSLKKTKSMVLKARKSFVIQAALISTKQEEKEKLFPQ